MGSSDADGLSQLYFKLVDAYKKKFVLQNGHFQYGRKWKKLSYGYGEKNGGLWLTRLPLKVVHWKEKF